MSTIQELIIRFSQTKSPQAYNSVLEAIQRQDKIWVTYSPVTKNHYIDYINGLPTAFVFSDKTYCDKFKEYLAGRNIKVLTMESSSENRVPLFSDFFRSGIEQVIIDNGQNFIRAGLFEIINRPDFSSLDESERPVMNPHFVRDCNRFFQAFDTMSATPDMEQKLLSGVTKAAFLLPLATEGRVPSGSVIRDVGNNGGKKVPAAAILDEDGRPMIPLFTDWIELSKFDKEQNTSCAVIQFNDVDKMCRQGENIVINPFGFHMVIDGNMLLTVRSAVGLPPVEIMRPTELTYTVPSSNIVNDSESVSLEKTDIQTETYTQENTNIQTETDTQEDTDIQTETDTPEDTDIQTETDTQKVTDIQAETDTQEDTDIQTEADTQKVTDISAEADTPEDTDIQTETDTQEVTDIPAETDTQEDTDIQSETDIQKDADIQSETDIQEVTDIQTETDTQEDTDIQAETDTQEDSDIQAESDTQEVTDIQTETDTQRDSDIQTETNTQENIDIQAETDTQEDTDIQAETDTPEDTDIQTETDTQEVTDIPAEAGTDTQEYTDIQAETNVPEDAESETQPDSIQDQIELFNLRSVPDSMIRELTTRLSEIPDVSKAYLKGIRMGEFVGYLVIVDYSGYDNNQFDRIAENMYPYTENIPVIFARTDSELGQEASSNNYPFYQK